MSKGKQGFQKGDENYGRKFGAWNRGIPNPSLVKRNKLRKGEKRSEKQKKKISKALKGKMPKNLKMIQKIKWTIERKKKLRYANKGEKNWNWKGGITPLRNQICNSYQYRQWISDVLTRDNFTCQECGKKGGKLSAHHTKSFSLILQENNIKTLEEALNCSELWNINNGLTLGQTCHEKTDNYGGKGNKKLCN